MMSVVLVIAYFIFKGCQDAILRTGIGFDPDAKYEKPKREYDLLFILNERFYKPLKNWPIKEQIKRAWWNVRVFFHNGFYKMWEQYHYVFGIKYIEKYPFSATLLVMWSDWWHRAGTLRHITVVLLGWMHTGLPIGWIAGIYGFGLVFFQISYISITNILKRN